jgi:superfamily II DNA or RNA helicase
MAIGNNIIEVDEHFNRILRLIFFLCFFREQSDREQALDDFKLGTVNILIATDVASRGLDIHDIT